MKISEVTDEILLEHLKIEEVDEVAKICSEAAKSYIKSYTGVEDIDSHEDFTIAYLILCADFYDNRQYTTDRNYSNKAVEIILNMHSRNLIPRGAKNV